MVNTKTTKDIDEATREEAVRRIDDALSKLREHRKGMGRFLRKKSVLYGWRRPLTWAYRLDLYKAHAMRTQAWLKIVRNPDKQDFGSQPDRGIIREGFLSLCVNGNGDILVVGEMYFQQGNWSTQEMTSPVTDISADGFSLVKWGFDPLAVESAVSRACDQYRL